MSVGCFLVVRVGGIPRLRPVYIESDANLAYEAHSEADLDCTFLPIRCTSLLLGKILVIRPVCLGVRPDEVVRCLVD